MNLSLLVAVIDFNHQLNDADLAFIREECHCELLRYDDDVILKGASSVDESCSDDVDLFDDAADTVGSNELQADIALLYSAPGALNETLTFMSAMRREQLVIPEATFVIVSKYQDGDTQCIHDAIKDLGEVVLFVHSSPYLKSTFLALTSIVQEKALAKNRADEASKVTFSSMVANSQLGETIRFFERSYGAANFDELCELFLETLRNLGLQGAVLIHVDGQSFYKTDSKDFVSLERDLHLHRTSNRFDQESFGLVVTFGKVRSVIFNMPPLEDETHGRLRDILATLIEGMNFCVQSISSQISSVVAERTKSLMLSTLSHELKTPMNAIVGFCSIIGRKVEGDVIQPRDVLGLHEVKDNVLRLKDIVDDLLALGDIDEGVIVEERLVLPDLLHEVFERTIREAAKKSVDFIVAPELEPALMKSDGKRIIQIVKNLLSNAVKFTLAGNIFYRQSLKTINDRNVVEVVIADTGIGIDGSNKERIFEPFVQLDMETTRAHEGAGIGLSVAKHMVEQLNGWIELSSILGSGSEFRVYIPTGR